MIEAVLFDMDGVLINSIASAHKARTKFLAQHGVDIAQVPDPQGEMHRGTSTKKLLATVEKHHGVAIDAGQFSKDVANYINNDLRGCQTAADPSLVAFLQDLQAHGIPCAITTSGGNKSVDYKLEILGIEQYFVLVVTGDDVEKHKPDPTPYLYTMKKLEVAPQNCVIFEDSMTGVQAGVAAGAVVIGFSKYNDDKDSFGGTRLTIGDWDEISYEKLTALMLSNA